MSQLPENPEQSTPDANTSASATNTQYGTGALENTTTGLNNTAIGYQALQQNTTGSNNSAIGYQALQKNIVGNRNTSLGSYALQKTTANDNTAVGYLALSADTTGVNNTALGYQAAASNSTGSNNVALGYNALASNLTSNYNVAIGSNALASTNQGFGANVAIGYYTLSATTGVDNIGIGRNAAKNTLYGDDNIFIGTYAGTYLGDTTNNQYTANRSIFIGYTARGSVLDSQTNQIVIGYQAIGGGSNSITLGNSSITRLRCQVTAITALSDSRVKENIEPANLDLCYDAVRNLPVTRYSYKNFTGTHLDKHVTGFMAEDVEKIFPKAVTTTDQYFPILDEEGNPVYQELENSNSVDAEVRADATQEPVEEKFLMKGVKEITMSEALPTLWGAVQALMAKVEALEKHETLN